MAIFLLFALSAYGSVLIAVNQDTKPQEPAPAPENNFPVRVISRTPIEYPKEAQTAKIQGTVIVELLIDEMGQVMSTTVISGDKRLSKAVIEAVKRWRFEPEMQNGRTVISTYTLPITFKLKNATDSTDSTDSTDKK